MWYDISAEPGDAYSCDGLQLSVLRDGKTERSTRVRCRCLRRSRDLRRTDSVRVPAKNGSVTRSCSCRQGKALARKMSRENIVGAPAQTSDTAYYFKIETLFENPDG